MFAPVASSREGNHASAVRRARQGCCEHRSKDVQQPPAAAETATWIAISTPRAKRHRRRRHGDANGRDSAQTPPPSGEPQRARPDLHPDRPAGSSRPTRPASIASASRFSHPATSAGSSGRRGSQGAGPARWSSPRWSHAATPAPSSARPYDGWSSARRWRLGQSTGQTFATLEGLASDRVKRIILYTSTRVLPVPLRDNVYTIQVPWTLLPGRLVAFDQAGRAVGLERIERPPATPRQNTAESARAHLHATAGARERSAREHGHRHRLHGREPSARADLLAPPRRPPDHALGARRGHRSRTLAIRRSPRSALLPAAASRRHLD